MAKTGKQRKPNYLFVWFSKITGWLPVYIFFKPKLYYMNKKVQGRRIKGPAILMSNHTALLDFWMYLLIFWDRVPRFIMAEVLFKKGKFLNWMLYAMGGIYLNRDNVGFSFVTESLETLDKGGVVGVFPQGRLPVDGQKFPFKPGIAMIATKTDAPIIPVYTDGNYGIKKRAHVMIGEPIRLSDYFDCKNPSKEDLNKMTEFLSAKEDELEEELKRRMKKEGK